MVAPVSVTSSAVNGVAPRNILDLIEFVKIRDRLLGVGTDSISVYTDGSLAGLGTVDMWAGAAIFFDSVDLGLGVKVSGLVSSTMAELQAIALALECVPPFSSIHLFSDIKEHFGVIGNKCVDALATAATMSEHFFPLRVNACYILVSGMAVSGNSRHFIGSGSRVLITSLHGNVDWCRSSLVWHSDIHMAADSTGKCSAGACTYFMKALYHQLSVTVRKCLYSRSYPSILCLYCGEVKVSNHVFSCGFDTAICAQLLDMHAAI
ncbi:hypothetical protein G9A89_004743 [Geosiphon pyriformis]|nr:hypothetical protein G9A89_004743 [Geosiphon pyriformis]